MADAPDVSLEQRTQAAFAVGWQMAELYSSPVPVAGKTNESAPDHLPGLSRLSSMQVFQLHLDQVDHGLTSLFSSAAPDAVTAAVAKLRATLLADSRSRDDIRTDIALLHEEALIALTVADFRLGKAYGLGRALAETVLLPSLATGDAILPAFQQKFSAGRLKNIFEWLADLKTVLPDHAAYAVSWSLGQWESWVHDAAANGIDTRAKAALRRQGQQWRALLSGERKGQDLLTTMDFVDAAKGLSSRLGRTVGAFASHYKGLIGASVSIAALVIGGIAAGAVLSGNGNVLWGELTAVVGLAGGWKGISGTLGKGLQRVEPSLWASELDAAIADRIVLLPEGATPLRQTTERVGLLVADDPAHIYQVAGDPGPE